MTQEHPITPPPELVREWSQNRGYSCADELWDYLATQAARWGADQELEACCEWISKQDWTWTKAQLVAARRPKPPSLKAQALTLIDECTDPHGDYLDDNALSIIRRALEALPD